MKPEDYEFLQKCDLCGGINTIWIWYPTRIGIAQRCTQHTIMNWNYPISLFNDEE